MRGLKMEKFWSSQKQCFDPAHDYETEGMPWVMLAFAFLAGLVAVLIYGSTIVIPHTNY